MRWKKPKPGDIKIKFRFLFIPHKDDNECRWLEWARLVYKYEARDHDNMEPYVWRWIGFQETVMADKLGGTSP